MQAAVKIVIEPIFEGDFMPCFFGFRPKRSTHDALQVLLDESWRGARWVVDTDSAAGDPGRPRLRPKQAKTRIVHLVEEDEGFDFLGFHNRRVRGRTARSRHLTFLARWPSARAMQHARDRIRELTDRRRLLVEVETIVGNLNHLLRGWSGYFRALRGLRSKRR